MKWEELICATRKHEENDLFSDDIFLNEFEKDYRRIVKSRIFRRLQDKTQAFPLEPDDFIRTRLTHSLEVSSTGKLLAETIFTKLRNEKKDEYFLKNTSKSFCDIIMCGGLIHDIGNPPFGHFGEYAIRNWFNKNLNNLYFNNTKITDLLSEQMILDLYNFEGNAQALRILSKSQSIGENKGLNLTYGVLNSIIKYPIPSTDILKDENDIKYSKMGYNFAEEDLFYEITKKTGAENNRHPLTFILEASDDIAYKIADIEDAIVKKIITYEELVDSFYQYKNKQMTKEQDSMFYLMIDVLEKSYKLSEKSNHKNPGINAIQRWGFILENKLINSATNGFFYNYDEIMEGSYKNDLFFRTDGEYVMKVLSTLAEDYIFKDKGKIKTELAGRKIIHSLLDTYIEAVIYFDEPGEKSLVNKKIMNIFSDYYKTIYFSNKKNKSDTEKLYLRLFMIVDYISSMTDSYAKKLYQELNGMKF